MDLSPYIDNLRRDLATAAAAGGEDARALAERLTAPLESAIRLSLLDALSSAADEITRELAPSSVEVRLRGGDPEFVVTTAARETEEAQEPPSDSPIPETDDGGTSRMTLRLPEQLKPRIEQAAVTAGISVNSWLVRAATESLTSGGRNRQGRHDVGRGYTGWVS
ncbi:hypothetical protein [Arthrobacter roseus]|uniref:hypothetical protein n=1 Tax=Arthrobacter roseus TaxID=136274 RepID=UPI001965C81D|nr:hypothetical protein [Arthrobacter roseus]MBM7847036.1 hypothetical protein [Arthrobacter roseus]